MNPQIPPTQDSFSDPYLQAQSPAPNNLAKVAIIVVVVLMLVALIGVTAYYYSQATKFKKQVASLQSEVGDLQAKNKELEESLNSASSSSNTTTTQSSQFFEIKEFGVRFKKTADIALPIYVANINNGSAPFSSQGLMNAAYVDAGKNGSSTTCNPSDNAIGEIVRGKAGKEINDTTIDKVQDAKKIGEFFYIFVSPESDCSETESVKTIEQKQISAFKAAFKTLEAIPASTKQ